MEGLLQKIHEGDLTIDTWRVYNNRYVKGTEYMKGLTKDMLRGYKNKCMEGV